MTKIYCDKCGEEIRKTPSEIEFRSSDIYPPLGYTYEFCDSCFEKIEAFATHKEESPSD